MNRLFDNHDNDYDSLNYSIQHRDMIDYLQNKKRSSILLKITIATFIVALASLIVGLIAIFK